MKHRRACNSLRLSLRATTFGIEGTGRVGHSNTLISSSARSFLGPLTRASAKSPADPRSVVRAPQGYDPHLSAASPAFTSARLLSAGFCQTLALTS